VKFALLYHGYSDASSFADTEPSRISKMHVPLRFLKLWWQRCNLESESDLLTLDASATVSSHLLSYLIVSHPPVQTMLLLVRRTLDHSAKHAMPLLGG
jgi:hypothetical protein